MSALCVCLFLPLLAAALPTPAQVRFDGDQVLRLEAGTEAGLSAVRALRNMSVALGLDWWQEPSAFRPADVRVPPSAMEAVQLALQGSGVRMSVMIENVQVLVEEQAVGVAAKGQADFDFSQYHELDDINTLLQTLPKEYPDLVTLLEVTTSYEGRTIYGVKVTGTTVGNMSAAAKPGFWIDGGIHAREWIAPATVLYVLNELLVQYNKDTEITNLVNSLDIFIVPVFNVDGYVYTYTTNRMWRKTRSANRGSSCIGTDPNRNFDYHWAEVGASGDPCDETYYGATAFSEVEVKGVADYIKSQTSMAAYFNIHSYSQLWLTNWGWTNARPKDYNTQMDLAKKSVDALTAVHGTVYEYGPSSTTIYPTSGGSDDWTYGALGIVHSYCIELRDTGRYGFLLPANQIIPTGEETLAGLLVSMKYVLDTA